VVKETKQDFELLIEDKKARIEATSLPVVKGNRMQLGQLFANLISNSLKFSTADPLIQITAAKINKDEIKNAPKTLKAGNYYHIRFRDNGIGFENQYSNKIFSLFQRLHGKQDYSGTGIGLALCKKIVEHHHGYIDATGEPGKGANFNVYLPISP
jgi:light-regulated signal transduction histidine kinase (bacteriophytochrome)